MPPVWVVAGSPGMTGAASLASRAAQRAGAGYVRLSSPGVEPARTPTRSRGRCRSRAGRDRPRMLDRVRASAVVGPGLGRGNRRSRPSGPWLVERPLPAVVDGDGLTALGDVEAARAVIGSRSQTTVLTPHDGEFDRLAGHEVPPDRLEGTRQLARGIGATVLLKGSTTVVADADGRVPLSAAGDPRLATAGTGDVLSGVVGAFLAQGMAGLEAAAAAAWVHGTAAHLGWRRGLVAGDLLDLVPAVLSDL